MRQEALRMERVSTRENDVIQLDGFNLSILAGEIMGLLPVNNHGLTSLLKLLQYNTPLRYGYVYYREEQVNTWRNSKQRHNRIGLIRSESCLVEGLTVTDNIFVLRPEFKTWILRPSILKKQLLPFLQSLDIDISAGAYVAELTAFEKVVVDVLKSVVAGFKLIVLQDISANIGEAELVKFHRLLKNYAARGISFLYIDFHIEELGQVCDKVALMSNGRIVKTLDNAAGLTDAFRNYTKAYISEVKQQAYAPAPAARDGGSVFEARGLTGEHVDGLSFSAASGECVVLQNPDVQVFGELLSMLSGERVPESGSLLIDGREIAPRIGGDIAVIQELPTETMLFKELSYLDNLCFLLDSRIPEVWRDHGIREGVGREFIPAPGAEVFDKRIDELTESQKYELVYTRIAIQKPKVVFCVQPFRSADIGQRMHIRGLMKMLLDKGIAVVILAVNLAGNLSLADRLVRLRKDKPDEVYLPGEFSGISLPAPWAE